MIHLLKKCGEKSPNCFTLVAINHPDQPLVFVNSVFRNLTQYTDKEILGRNCRFLQGPLSNQQTTLRIRERISSRQIICEDLLNYKKDQTPFWNRLVLLPFESKSELHYFGFQHDVTARKKEIESGISDSPNQTIDQNDVGHWLKNRLNVILMNLQILERGENSKAICRIEESFKLISNYVQALRI